MACKFLGAIIKGIVILYLHDIIYTTLRNRMSVVKSVQDENKNAVNILMEKSSWYKICKLDKTCQSVRFASDRWKLFFVKHENIFAIASFFLKTKKMFKGIAAGNKWWLNTLLLKWLKNNLVSWPKKFQFSV